jgi:hypothetical protein
MIDALSLEALHGGRGYAQRGDVVPLDWVILTGLAGLATIPIPGVLMAALALIAGVLILVGR